MKKNLINSVLIVCIAFALIYFVLAVFVSLNVANTCLAAGYKDSRVTFDFKKYCLTGSFGNYKALPVVNGIVQKLNKEELQ